MTGCCRERFRRIAELIATAGVQAIRTDVCTYHWPSMTGRSYGRLTVPLRSGQELRNCREWQARVMAGQCDYKQLPMLYNGGYVSMAALNLIKARTGVYYRSCIPDLYSAMTLSSVLDTYLYVYDASAINGASKHSTGTSQFSANASQASSPAARFAAEGNLPFHPAVPMNTDGSYPASIQALAYESYLQSASLRPGPVPDIAALQLELVLASAGPRASRIRDWGRLFATMHHLDFEKISSRARVQKIGMDVRGVWSIVSTVAGAWTDGSPEQPIVDVHAAGLIAKSVMEKRPGFVRRWLRLLRDMPRLVDYLFVYLKRV